MISRYSTFVALKVDSLLAYDRQFYATRKSRNVIGTRCLAVLWCQHRSG